MAEEFEADASVHLPFDHLPSYEADAVVITEGDRIRGRHAAGSVPNAEHGYPVSYIPSERVADRSHEYRNLALTT